MKTMNQVDQSQELAGVSTETLRAAEADGQAGLAGRELDAAVAERVMGYVVGHWGDMDVAARSKEKLLAGYATPVRDYSTDIAAAMEVEDRIAELGLQDKYVDALYEMLRAGEFGGRWKLIRATAEQRCRAALQATNTAKPVQPSPKR